MNHDQEPLSAHIWVLLSAVLAGCGAAWVAWVPLGGIPHVSDEIAYTLQSRLFAAGMRVGEAADNASMWVYPFWNSDGPMYSPFPIGWPMLLSLGERMGLAGWVNPLLCGVAPVLVYRIGRSVQDVRTGVLAALICACSPGLWIMGGSRMAHTSVLIALGVLVVTVLERSDSWKAWAVGAASAAYVVLARPFDAALLAAPLLAWGLMPAHRARSLGWWIGLPAAATVLVLMDNQALTGDWFRFPMSDWYDQWQDRTGCNRLGFGADVGCAQTLGSWGHSPTKALSLAWETAQRFDRLFLGVPGGGLLAVLFALWKRAKIGWVWVALVVVGYALYWSPGRAFGARFWHPLYLVAPVALAMGLAPLRRLWVVLGLMGLSVVGLSRASAELADDYWCTSPGLSHSLQAQGIDSGVVFIRSVGVQPVSWPRLGVERFSCDPMLASGNGWLLAHPETPRGGIQIRHALPNMDQTRAFIAAHHPNQPAWLVVQDVRSGTHQVRALELSSGH